GDGVEGQEVGVAEVPEDGHGAGDRVQLDVAGGRDELVDLDVASVAELGEIDVDEAPEASHPKVGRDHEAAVEVVAEVVETGGDVAGRRGRLAVHVALGTGDPDVGGDAPGGLGLGRRPGQRQGRMR